MVYLEGNTQHAETRQGRDQEMNFPKTGHEKQYFQSQNRGVLVGRRCSICNINRKLNRVEEGYLEKRIRILKGKRMFGGYPKVLALEVAS